MAEIVWTRGALEDLRHIVEYIALDSTLYGERTGRRLAEAPGRLEEFPLSGRIVPEYNRPSLRELIVGAYRILYRICDEQCEILAIAHSSQDIPRFMPFEKLDAE